jgi:ABC-type Na+ transport system ATPase subunit NatA
MSEIMTSLQTIVIDHVRLSLMNQLRNGESTNIVKLVSVALVVGLVAWVYEYATGENQRGFKELIYEWRSYVQRKHCIIIEGKHATGIDHYSRRPITIANTFSKNFRAVLFHVVQHVNTMPDIRELKEFATNIIKGEHYEGKGAEDVKTIFTVSQKTPFLLDAAKEIYCTIKEAGEQRETEGMSKTESRIVKFHIAIFSYKTNVAELADYIRRLKSTYQKHLEDKRKDRLFVYTLNNVEVRNDDDDDTVGGWQETPHETMKSFDNLFFDGKQEILKKIDFFVNNKEWYKRNGVPYTLGIGLYGPPGTGKTSFIKALATHLGRHIVSMSLSRIKTKKQLQDFYYETQYSNANEKNAVGFDKKIVVFEDIDCVGDLVLSRNAKTSEDSSSLEDDDDDDFTDAAPTKDQILKREINKAAKYISKKMNSTNGGAFGPSNSLQDNLTMDDLLNLWDGIRENTGRIMIITTNHYNKLDPALVRPGRIDIAIKLDNASLGSINEMYEHYYGKPMDRNDLTVIPDRFYSPAEIINFYVSNHENPRGFVERLACSKKICE